MMKIVRDIISIGLVLSGLLGTQVLVTDKWLWVSAPTHALGLLGFVVIDLALGLAIWWRTLIAIVGGAFASGIQLVAMLADIAVGQPMGVAASAFRLYLLSDSSYILLLLTQLSILTIGAVALASPFIHRHVRWATLLRVVRP
ncbi:MAG TPA: hypothetical protein VFV92_07340 [Candidatus Bathyarchaeia archaeon]|nr:hypothetical protein [Candidatus Bathyarchaeia archaeon]